MKKKNITGIIGIAIFVIGIVAALVIYKRCRQYQKKQRQEKKQIRLY